MFKSIWVKSCNINIDQTRELKIGEISILSENHLTFKLLCQLKFKAILFSVYN